MKIHGTAKGGALTTKDFGVAISVDTTPAFEFEQNCRDESIGMSSSYFAYGIDLTNSFFYSQTIASINFKLTSDGGSQNSNLTCWVYTNPSDLSAKTQLGSTINQTFTTASFDSVDFSGSGVTLSSSGGYCLMEYSNNNLRIGIADATASEPCTPDSTIAETSRITSGGTLSNPGTYYTTVVIG